MYRKNSLQISKMQVFHWARTISVLIYEYFEGWGEAWINSKVTDASPDVLIINGWAEVWTKIQMVQRRPC